MSVTIEYNKYRFWDWDGIFPGETVADAFQKAGGKVAYDDGEVIVSGLSLEDALKIAGTYQADYMGPVMSSLSPREEFKDITNVRQAKPLTLA